MTSLDGLIERLREIAGTPPGEQSLWDCTVAAWASDELERSSAQSALMAQEWCEFCAAIGVNVDTQEVVADQVVELHAALEPFATYMQDGGDRDHKGAPLPDDHGVGWVYLTVGDFRRASAAFTALNQQAKP